MTTTTTRKKRSTAPLVGVKDLSAAEEPGVFSAIVSVFGNVDYQNDRIIPGAFAGTLERWKASGDPIPVVWSHQWDNLDAHVGHVIDAKELLPGDPELVGTGLEGNGGLWTKFALAVEEDFAGRLAKRLSNRSIKEFSFAYDVLDEQRGTDGANELLELDVIEVGPTLKGANPATRLLSAAGVDELDEKAVERLEKVLFAGRKALEDAEPDGSKASVPVTFDGSVESTLAGVHEAATAWAEDGNLGNGGFYYLHLEATYPDEGRAIVCVEGWDDPIGEGVFYELSFASAEDGTLEVSDPHELEVAVSTSRKARKARARLAHPPLGEKARGTVSDEPDGGKSDDKAGKSAEDPTSRTEDGDHDGGDPLSVMLELAELE